MSKRKKRIKKLLENPKSVKFEDLDIVLREFGYFRSQPGSGSSHYTYSKEGLDAIITVPFKRPCVKEIYVKNVIKLLDLEEWYEQNR